MTSSAGAAFGFDNRAEYNGLHASSGDMSRCPLHLHELRKAPSLELISETIIHPLVFSLWMQGANTEVNDVCFRPPFFLVPARPQRKNYVSFNSLINLQLAWCI